MSKIEGGGCHQLKRDPSLTEADIDALKRMPDGRWFRLDEVPFMVRNKRYRCDRLTEKGVLETRVTGWWPNTDVLWRKRVQEERNDDAKDRE